MNQSNLYDPKVPDSFATEKTGLTLTYNPKDGLTINTLIGLRQVYGKVYECMIR